MGNIFAQRFPIDRRRKWIAMDNNKVIQMMLQISHHAINLRWIHGQRFKPSVNCEKRMDIKTRFSVSWLGLPWLGCIIQKKPTNSAKIKRTPEQYGWSKLMSFFYFLSFWLYFPSWLKKDVWLRPHWSFNYECWQQNVQSVWGFFFCWYMIHIFSAMIIFLDVSNLIYFTLTTYRIINLMAVFNLATERQKQL